MEKLDAVQNAGNEAVASYSGITVHAFLSALTTSTIVFVLQIITFIFVKGHISRIYIPRTYLGPHSERTEAPPHTALGWLVLVFRMSEEDLIRRCGLDSYFFLRYLRTCLLIFGPALILAVPILLPLNYVNGNGQNTPMPGTIPQRMSNVTGLDTLSWANIKPSNHQRYWAHLIIALLLILWSCSVFWKELQSYVDISHKHIASSQYPDQESAAKTLLLTSVPPNWMDIEKLKSLFNILPGGVRNIWLNRDYSTLSQKTVRREEVVKKLENIATHIIRSFARNSDITESNTGGPHALVPGAMNCNGYTPDLQSDKEGKRDLYGMLKRSNIVSDRPEILPTRGPLTWDESEQASRWLKATARADRELSKGYEDEQSAGRPSRLYVRAKACTNHFVMQYMIRLMPFESIRMPYFNSLQAITRSQPLVTPEDWACSLPYLFSRQKESFMAYEAELRKLNEQIAVDQKDPESFSLSNSAFIQFHQKVAAQVAGQCLVNGAPKQMDPRTLNVAPDAVVWNNISLGWAGGWWRSGGTSLIAALVVLLWAIPMAWAASLVQLDALMDRWPWLRFLKSNSTALNLVSGVLPTIVTALMLTLAPQIFQGLALQRGAYTTVHQELLVQKYYFSFLFVQIFLVASISGGTFAILGANIRNAAAVSQLLAQNLPKAANYFFSYMLLQAMSTSGNTLLQTTSLLYWLLLPHSWDKTPRDRWNRRKAVPKHTWGTVFPIYTNFACICLIYSVIAPIILILSIITFLLAYISNSYNALYVYQTAPDSGGLYYPRAINQTFTGIYVMEMCLVGLFLLARNEHNDLVCYPQAIIMAVATVLTGLFQIFLRHCFGPLMKSLPLTSCTINDTSCENLGTRLSMIRRLDQTIDLSQNSSSQENHRENHELVETQARTSKSQNNLSIPYTHPCLQSVQSVIWIPKDSLGISKLLLESAGRTIRMTDVDATIDKKGRIRVGKSRPVGVV